MSNSERSVYWPIMVAASIGALGTVAAAVINRPELLSGLGARSPSAAGGMDASGPVHSARARRTASAGPAEIPAHWIDARGRYYEIKRSGERIGIIAYKGGADALANDVTRLAGDGTIAGGHIAWSWQGAHGDRIEDCDGTASPTAISVDCGHNAHGVYELRLVAR